ncbi:hypothetical protein ABZP36_008207 [Zizania latifolia]
MEIGEANGQSEKKTTFGPSAASPSVSEVVAIKLLSSSVICPLPLTILLSGTVTEDKELRMECRAHNSAAQWEYLSFADHCSDILEKPEKWIEGKQGCLNY